MPARRLVLGLLLSGIAASPAAGQTLREADRGAFRIDGVGIEGHWGLYYPSLEHVEATIDSFAALGVRVVITELDVDVLPLTREGQVIGSVLSDPYPEFEPPL